VDHDLELYGTAAGEVAAAVAGTSPGREGLEWVADIIRGRRARTQIKVLTKVAAALDEAGLSANVVPNKVLVPLLEFAGLEDDDDEEMLERWANLLVSAATAPDRGHVAYPEILRQLESIEARMLDAMHDALDAEMSAKSSGTKRLDGFGPAWFGASLDLDPTAYVRAVPNLVRLQLARQLGGPNDPPHVMTIATSDLLSSPIQLTFLGMAFVWACRPPGTARLGILSIYPDDSETSRS
jgi:hypothetical protein